MQHVLTEFLCKVYFYFLRIIIESLVYLKKKVRKCIYQWSSLCIALYQSGEKFNGFQLLAAVPEN